MELPGNPRPPAGRLLTPAILLAGFTLLILAARGDFWLDEVWSFGWAANAVTPWDVFRVTHDNNHPLNTLWLWLVGTSASPLLARALAVGSGIGSLILMDRILLRFDPMARVPGICLMAFSYPLVLYFSEARGYGAAVFCALAITWILLRWPVPSAAPVLAFLMACMIGTLGHANFLFALAGLGLWYFATQFRVSPRLAVGRSLLYFGPPLLPLLLYFALFVTRVEVAGGPEFPLPLLVAQHFGHALGIPVTAGFVALPLILIVLLLAAGFVLAPRGPALLALLIVIVIPVLSLPIIQRSVNGFRIYPRYYLVCLPFLYLLLALALARALRSPHRALRLLAAGSLCLYAAGQAMPLSGLLRYGRGEYTEALTYIASITPSGATLGADNDYTTQPVFRFLQEKDSRLAKLRYATVDQWPVYPPDWLVLDSWDRPAEPPKPQIVIDAGSYRYERTFPSARLSGCYWILYRRQ